MCWAREWARALNNLNWAIIHCRRAEKKLEKRHNIEGQHYASMVIQALENIQGEIKSLIEFYGISRTGGKMLSKMIDEAMAGKRTVKGQVDAWVEKY